MTIFTRPLSEKKPEKLTPLVENDQADALPLKEDAEAGLPIDRPRLVILRTRVRRVSTSTTLCLLMTALMVVGIGIVGGTYLYRQYLRAQMHRFRGWCNIPYDSKGLEFQLGDSNLFADSKMFRSLNYDDTSSNRPLGESFQEEFEIDVESDSFEKIEVPNFRDGRSGRFIHDFNTNLTGIIDLNGKRCFVMPLNRNSVLPPRSLYDLVHKMWEGIYAVDTDVIRETMRVVIPPMTDVKELGGYITRECRGLPIYKLEKYVSGVVKRSADPLESEAKFAHFSGKGIFMFDLINMPDVKSYEENLAEH